MGIIVVSGAAYAGIIASHRRQLFGMSLWLFTYIFMGMAPYVQHRLDQAPETTPNVNESLFPVAGGLVIASCLSAVFFSYLAGRRRLPVKAMAVSAVDRRRANILTFAGVAIFLYYGSQVGFGSFLLSREELADARGRAWPDVTVAEIFTGALQMGLLVGFLAQMAVRRQRKMAGVRPGFMMALLNGLLLLYAVNPVSTTRYVFGTAALAVLASFGVYATINRFRVMAAGALVGMLILFPLADMFRHRSAANFEITGPVRTLASGDFDAFTQFTNTLDYIAHHGITYGNQLLGVLFLWVPRRFWPEKPTGTGSLLAEYKGYGFTNLSAPIWAELAINFGWIAVILGLGVIGYLFKTWDLKTDLYLRAARIPPVMVSAAAFYMIIFLRGSMLAVTSYLLVIIAASWFVKKRPRRGKARIRVPRAAPPLQTAPRPIDLHLARNR